LLATTRETNEYDSRSTFEVICSDGTHLILQAEYDAECFEWCNILRSITANMIEKNFNYDDKKQIKTGNNNNDFILKELTTYMKSSSCSDCGTDSPN